jgi:uncharacterized protein YfdQ (DUF2303 family)
VTIPSALGTGEAEAIINAISALSGTTTVSLSDLLNRPEALVIPKGMGIQSLKKLHDEFRDRPERVRTTIACASGDAMIDYLNRFKTPASMAFYEVSSPACVLAALDYHEPGPVAVMESGDAASMAALASFVTHFAVYNFPLSKELLAWLDGQAKPMTSPEFAEFLEDRENDIENPPVDWGMVDQTLLQEVLESLNLHDDKAPVDENGIYLSVRVSGADPGGEDDEETYRPRTAVEKLREIRFATQMQIVHLARTVEVSSASKAASFYDPQSGARVLSFQEENEMRGAAGRKVKVPHAFFVHIPVFAGEPRRLIPVRLKYRVRGTSVVWLLEIVDATRMIARAIEAVAQRIAASTGVPMVAGMPVGNAFVSAVTARDNQTKELKQFLGLKD